MYQLWRVAPTAGLAVAALRSPLPANSSPLAKELTEYGGSLRALVHTVRPAKLSRMGSIGSRPCVLRRASRKSLERLPTRKEVMSPIRQIGRGRCGTIHE
jgi:hypothetical protein